MNLLVKTNKNTYSKRGAQNASHAISSKLIRRRISTGSLTTIYEESFIGAKLNKFLQMHNLTDIQNDIILKITSEINSIAPISNIEFNEGPENQALISFNSNDGIHMIVITEDGDVMISFSGYKFSDGWREFYDYNQLDVEKFTYKFLTSIRN